MLALHSPQCHLDTALVSPSLFFSFCRSLSLSHSLSLSFKTLKGQNSCPTQRASTCPTPQLLIMHFHSPSRNAHYHKKRKKNHCSVYFALEKAFYEFASSKSLWKHYVWANNETRGNIAWQIAIPEHLFVHCCGLIQQNLYFFHSLYSYMSLCSQDYMYLSGLSRDSTRTTTSSQ